MTMCALNEVKGMGVIMDIKNLYELVILAQDLTTANLESKGFSSKSLTKLVNDGKLERYKRGYYIFNDIKGLYNYGNLLLEEGNLIKAKICFLRCLEIDALDIKVNKKLFDLELKFKNFEEAFSYLDIIYDKDYKNRKLYNTYLFLFSFILDLPMDYKNIVNNLTIDDLDINISNSLFRDIIIEDIYYQRFSKAITKIQSLHDNNKILDLLYRVRYEEKQEIININDLINKGKIEELILLLEQKKIKNSSFYNYVLVIAREIVNVKETKIVPKKIERPIKNLKEALLAHDYERALTIVINNDKSNNLNSNTLYLLLNVLIKEIKRDYWKDILNKVQEDGLVILGEMNKEEIKRALERFKDIPYISFMLLGENDNILVLRYYSENKKFNYEDILNNSFAAYHNFQYKECIEYLRILGGRANVLPANYAKLGFAYAKINNYELAKKYLFVANELNKKFGINCSNEELLKSLETQDEEFVHKALQRVKNPF